MKLDPRQRAVVQAALAEAHRGIARGVRTRTIAARFLAALRDSERFGHGDWIDTYLDDLAVAGAMKVAADWRRRHRTAELTAKGTRLDVPAYASTVRDGHYVQQSLDGLDLPALRHKRAKLAAQRDTLSREVSFLGDLIATMEADNLATAGEARTVLASEAAAS